ncbi:class I SAM-dependent methyltransferase [Bdellovibrio bacteriovorus]
MDGIGKTSLLVAAMRAAESKRPDTEGRLFTDPFAEKLAGPEGFALLNKAIEISGDQPAIAIRTRFIDDRIKEALNNGYRQIVMLAAGMDARAFRLDFPAGTTLFEVDRKEVLDYKKEKLAEAKPRCERHTIASDLRQEWKNMLLNAGFKPKEKTIWMTEGLLMYLDEADVHTVIEKITQLAAKDDILLFDILSRTLLEAPFMKNQLEFLAGIGAPWLFGSNDPVAFMKSFGWQAKLTQNGEVAPDRWPFPVIPLHVTNVPRGFFVQATKL